MAAALAAEPGLAVAAERRRRVEPVERVRPDHPGPQPRRQPARQRPALGPDPGRQPVAGAARPFDRLGRGGERRHGQHRPRQLGAADAVRVRHVGEHRRREPEAVVGQQAGRRPAPRSLRLARGGQLGDLVQLGAGDDRADVGVRRQAGRPAASAPIRRLIAATSVVAGRRLDQHARPGAAHVALVDEDAGDDRAGRRLDVRVGADDVHRRAAELERQRLARQRAGPRDLLADLGRAGERHLVEPRVARHQLAGGLPSPVTTLTTPGGRSACLQISANASAVSGVASDGFRMTVFPQARAGAICHASISRGELQEIDLADHAERPRRRPEPGVAQLVGPAGVVEEVRRRQRDVHARGSA